MRTNLPVTQREYQFPGHETLLSTTDVTSHIKQGRGFAVVASEVRSLAGRSAAAAISMGDQAQRLVEAVKVFSI